MLATQLRQSGSILRRSGCVAHWRCTGGPAAQRGTIRDLTGGLPLTAYGAPAVSFDGTGDYVEMFYYGAGPAILSNVAYAWFAVRVVPTAVNCAIIYLGSNETAGGYDLRVSVGSGYRIDVMANVSGTTRTAVTAANAVPQNQASYLLVCVDVANSRAIIWVNGALVGSYAFNAALGAATYPTTTTKHLSLGAQTRTTWPYIGKISLAGLAGKSVIATLADAKFFHDFPVQFLKQRIGTTLADYWLCNEGTGAPVTSASGTRNGTITGASWDVGANGGQPWPGGADSFQGGGKTFDGVDDYAAATDAADLLDIPGDATYLFAFKPDNLDAAYGLYDRVDLGDGAGIEIAALADATMQAADGTNLLESGADLTAGAINVVALAIDSGAGEGQWYVNGAASGAAGTLVVPTKAGKIVRLGIATAIGTYLPGTIYETQIYNRELSLGEIKALTGRLRRYN